MARLLIFLSARSRNSVWKLSNLYIIACDFQTFLTHTMPTVPLSAEPKRLSAATLYPENPEKNRISTSTRTVVLVDIFDKSCA